MLKREKRIATTVFGLSRNDGAWSLLGPLAGSGTLQIGVDEALQIAAPHKIADFAGVPRGFNRFPASELPKIGRRKCGGGALRPMDGVNGLTWPTRRWRRTSDRR